MLLACPGIPDALRHPPNWAKREPALTARPRTVAIACGASWEGKAYLLSYRTRIALPLWVTLA
jgi:hypothetical protein